MNANGFRQFPERRAFFLRHIYDNAASVAALQLGKSTILPARAHTTLEVAIWALVGSCLALACAVAPRSTAKRSRQLPKRTDASALAP